jgi:hypothetical protein
MVADKKIGECNETNSELATFRIMGILNFVKWFHE